METTRVYWHLSEVNKDFAHIEELLSLLDAVDEIGCVYWTDYNAAGEPTGQGGICVRRDCDCSGTRTYWRNKQDDA